MLLEVLAFIKPGQLIADVCAFGDEAIEKAMAKVYKAKKDLEKGVAFPTCVSVNETLAYYSPLRSESTSLAAGDAVKVALGTHIDGAVALVAHTLVLGAGAEGGAAAAPVEVVGPQADVIVAAYEAAEVALRVIKPGVSNAEVTAAIEGVARAYGVAPFTAVQGAQLQRFALDGGKVIPQKKELDGTKFPGAKFEAGEVYSIDIAFTTGDGKMHESEQRTTVFKRQVDVRFEESKLAAMPPSPLVLIAPGATLTPGDPYPPPPPPLPLPPLRRSRRR